MRMNPKLLLYLLAVVALAITFTVPAVAQGAPPQGASAGNSGGNQQQDVPEAGGPEINTSPVVVPKKKEEPPPPPQKKVKNPEGMGDYTLSVSVPVVTVDCLVTTKSGEFLPGLKRENFKVMEDGVPQTVTSFQQTEAPITAVLVLEFASTYASFINDMFNYAYGFASSLKPQDWVAVVSYDMKTRLEQDFTQDKRQVFGALNRMQMPMFRETNEFDALYYTLDRLERVEGHKYIILISSGRDTFSKLNYDEVLKKVKISHDVTIFAVSTGQWVRTVSDPYTPATVRMDYLQADNEMNTFAKLTGGRAYFPRFQGEVREIMGDISNSIRNQYSLTYHSTNTKQDGTYRKIKVELVDAETGGPINLHVNGKPAKYNIIAREGYTAKKEVE